MDLSDIRGEIRPAVCPTPHPPESKYDSEVVRAYCADPDAALQQYSLPTRHYSQSIYADRHAFPAVTDELLDLLSIPADTTAVVLGGYTGEFAAALQRRGHNIIFTDPHPDWVRAARERGLETTQAYAHTIPAAISSQADVFATFECYPMLGGQVSFPQVVLRLLTAPYGFIFAETDRSRAEMGAMPPELRDEEFDPANLDFSRRLALGLIKYEFTPFREVYDAQFANHTLEGLRMHNISLPETGRANACFDLYAFQTACEVARSREVDRLSLDDATLRMLVDQMTVDTNSQALRAAFQRLDAVQEQFDAPVGWFEMTSPSELRLKLE